MNIYAVVISFLIIVTLVLLIIGIKRFTQRNIEIDKFKPNYREKKKKVKKVKNNYDLPYYKVVGLIAVAGLSVGILVYAVVGNITLAGFSCFMGLAFPNVWYKWYKKSQEDLMTKQMEKVAETMAAVIRSEGSMVAALERACIGLGEPLQSRLVKTTNEIRLGVPTDVAFANLEKSINVPEMLIVSIGVDLQQKGMAINMATMLEQVQKNIRSRQAFKQEINAISAENKMAGWIVAAVPFFTLGVMRKVSPDFVNPLFNTPVGLGILIVCVAVIAVGIYWMMKIADVN